MTKMKAYLFIFLLLVQPVGLVVWGSVSYVTTVTSNPVYSSQTGTFAVTYTSTSRIDPNGGTEYETTATYGSLSSGTLLRFYTANTFHVYGPYGSMASEWSLPSDQGGYSGISLLQNSSGGSVRLISYTPITAVNYEGTAMVQTGTTDEYSHVITYGALDAGSSLLLYTANSFHVYGPYGTSDSWGLPVDHGGYASLSLSSPTSGGNVTVYTYTPLNSISAVPEPSTGALLLIGMSALAALRRRKN